MVYALYLICQGHSKKQPVKIAVSLKRHKVP